jgi:hypothetical protein
VSIKAETLLFVLLRYARQPSWSPEFTKFTFVPICACFQVIPPSLVTSYSTDVPVGFHEIAAVIVRSGVVRVAVIADDVIIPDVVVGVPIEVTVDLPLVKILCALELGHWVL